MRNFFFTSLVFAGLIGVIPTQGALAAAGYESSAPDAAEITRMQQRQSVLLEAHLASMKAGLKLNDEQTKSWAIFESAIRDAGKARSDRWTQARERMNTGERPSPVERLSLMADHLEKNAEELRKVAVAGKPLYEGLNDEQKRAFGSLMREFKPKQQF